MSKVRLAAFVGKGNLFNSAIRRRTHSNVSHTELIIDGLWYSSSVGDGGVRRKHVDPKPGEWEYVDLPWADADAVIAWFDRHEDDHYGMWDIVCQLFSINLDGKGEICSEACAEALGFQQGWKLTPGKLLQRCKEKTLAWEAARNGGR